MRKSRGIRLLRTLGFSCLSFSLSLPLFSSACRLFCQNTGGGGASATSPPSLPLGAVTPHRFFKTFVFINLQIPFPVTPLAAHLYKTPGCHPGSRPSITLPTSQSWTLALFSSLLTLSREQSIAAQQFTAAQRSVAGDLDTSLRPLRTLVALRADRVAAHHCSLRFTGWPARQAPLGGADRSRHRHPGRHDRLPHARVTGRRKLSLRRCHRPDEHRLDRRSRGLSLRHLR